METKRKLLPRSIIKLIHSSIRNTERVSKWPDFFYTNDDLNEWLTRKIDLTADNCEIEIDTFTFRFNWVNERWSVKS